MFRTLRLCLRELISGYKCRSQSIMMPEMFCLFAQRARSEPLRPPVYCPRELPTKMDVVEDSALNGDDRGNHKKPLCSTFLWASIAKVYQKLMQSRTKLKRMFKMFTRCKFCRECEVERIKLVAFTKIRI